MKGAVIVGGFSQPIDLLYDGAHIFAADAGTAMLHKLNPDGSIALSVASGCCGYDARSDASCMLDVAYPRAPTQTLVLAQAQPIDELNASM